MSKRTDLEIQRDVYLATTEHRNSGARKLTRRGRNIKNLALERELEAQKWAEKGNVLRKQYEVKREAAIQDHFDNGNVL